MRNILGFINIDALYDKDAQGKLYLLMDKKRSKKEYKKIIIDPSKKIKNIQR